MKINTKLNHKTIWFDSIIGMTWGFLATLVVGTIIGLLSIEQNNDFSKVIDKIKGILTMLTPFGIGLGIGLKTKMKPIQIIAIFIAAGLIGHSTLIPEFKNNSIDWTSAKIGFKPLEILGTRETFIPGDVFGAWLGATFVTYFFKIFEWYTLLDAIVIPLVGVTLGLIGSLFITYLTSTIIVLLEWIIDNSANKYHWAAILLAPIIGAVMGLALSFPTSSAAIAISVVLKGDAATAAIAGTTAQMISFGVMTYMSTKKIGSAISVGFGSSMLQMHNFMRKPKLLIIPVLVSALTALLAVSAVPLDFPTETGSVTSGMGSCALYGQIFTLKENGWTNEFAWLNIIVIQLAFPLLITIPMFLWPLKKKWIMPRELELEVKHG